MKIKERAKRWFIEIGLVIIVGLLMSYVVVALIVGIYNWNKSNASMKKIKQDICLNECFESLKPNLRAAGFSEVEISKVNFAEMCVKMCYRVDD